MKLLSALALALASVSALAQDFPGKPLPVRVPQPAGNISNQWKIELGKQLYFDPRLSKTGSVSCNSCHNVMLGGEDNMQFSTGIEGKLGGRNAPTVWNAAFMSVQFWDGRAPSLEEQAKGPLTNPVEMGMENHDAVVARVKQIPGYVSQFKGVFGGSADAVNIDNIAKAIAAYERTLITRNSPFDRYSRGEKGAMSAAAVRGMKTAQTVGCMTCHMGVNFAGPQLPEGTGFYQKFPTYTDNDYVNRYELQGDTGRYEVTKNEADRHMWRVPTWRNVALTAPYFHNGSVKSLDEAVRVMAKTQLNKDLTEQEVSDIVAFLNSLTGEFPKQTMPKLPGYANTTFF